MRIYKQLALIILDIISINLCLLITLSLKFDGTIPAPYFTVYENIFVAFTLISIGIFIIGHLYTSLWSYAGSKEVLEILFYTLLSVICSYMYMEFKHLYYPLSVYVIYSILEFVSLSVIRFTYRILRRLLHSNFKLQSIIEPKERLLLVGAGEAASIIIKEFTLHHPEEKIVVAVDDDTYKQHTLINSVPIKGTSKDIPQLAHKYKINKIIIAIPSASKKRISELIEICHLASCSLQIFPGIQNALNFDAASHLRPVNIEDLLGRDEIMLDNTPLVEQFKEKTLLVTGGGGSIGSELCRQLVRYPISKLIIFDIYENNAYELQNELLNSGISKDKIEIVIGSVRDMQKLQQVFMRFKPNFVFHAAAHKHVPLMEANPCEAIKNNVYGTLNTALCAKQFKVEKFILISTDKAVNPTNIMGASKRLCEMIIQSLANSNCETHFAAVRFGNVLGSNGSVLPLFKKQIEMGGPVTVTHEEIIRYFMTIKEAVRLILQASLFAEGGEIFVLNMGDPVKIMDLAKNYIKLSGLTPGKDIDIKVTGLRPGEKLYEELLMSEEGLTQTNCSKIFVGRPMTINFNLLHYALIHLQDSFYDEKQLKLAIMGLVPTYKPTSFNESILEEPSSLSAT